MKRFGFWAVAVLLMTGCVPTSADETPAPSSSAPSWSPSIAAPPTVVASDVPDMTGVQLDEALEQLRAIDGLVVETQDDSAEKRTILVNSNWVVTAQSLKGMRLTLSALKTDEYQSSTMAPVAPGDIPSTVGMALDDAIAQLESIHGVVVEAKDASDKNRNIIVEGNWVVTRQDISRNTVTLSALKKEESPGAAAGTSGLAAEVDTQLRAGLGVTNYTEMSSSDWVIYIASIEDAPSSGVVIVTLQRDADKDFLKRVALNIMNLVGPQLTALEWVQVNSIDGHTGQVSRADSPLIND